MRAPATSEHSNRSAAPLRSPAPHVLEEIVRRVVEVAQPEKIVLFGSAARGSMGPDSDVDLLVIKRDVLRKRALATEIRRALRGVPEAFDILIATPEELERYGESPGLVFREALLEGKTLYVA